MTFKACVRCGQEEFLKEYFETTSVSTIIRESGFSFDMPCDGRGVCGNCAVIIEGCASDVNDDESHALGERLKLGYRLACFAKVSGDCVITVPKSASPDFKGDSSVRVTPDPISGDKPCFACAVDVGTTTIALRYFSLPDGKLIFSDSADNPQRIHGADVISRIDGSSDKHKALSDMINRALADSAKRFGKEIEFYVIAANTIMLHFLAGFDPSDIATAPFTPKSLFGNMIGNRYYMRCADAYIGGDAIASVIQSGMLDFDEPAVLLDVGTNNECFLWDGKRLYGCSTPAGPAFEGASISCGMPARDGAICKIDEADGEISITTVDENAKASGLCASGLIDAIAYLLKNKYVAFDGSVIKPIPSFDGVTLKPEDIAELQLAKSAVCAGILTLIEHAKLTPESIKRLYVTGSFGRGLNVNNAELIGLLPKGFASLPYYAVEGAIGGASMALLNKNYLFESETIAEMTEVVELADSDCFAGRFIENMYFGEFQ